MAVYHLACRIAHDGSANPPARVAKYNGNCALPGCDKSIHKGDMISCTRDNEKGVRKEKGVKGTVPDHRDPPDANEETEETAETAETEEPSAPSTPFSEPASTANVAMRALAKELAPYLTIPTTTPSTDLTAKVAELAALVTSVTAPRVVVVHAPHVEAVNVGIQHKQFPLLAKALASGCNVWVTGPAGSGKTTGVHNAAIALGKEYGYTGSCQDQYALTGFMNAQGQYVRTPLRERYEHGGLFLWDEVDGSDPNALLAFNAMLANGTASFPDGMIRRHPDTLLAATANTFGLGGTAEYVGRNRLDAAFLDRFVFIDWQIDEALESATCSDAAWVKRVQYIRSRVKAKGLKVLVTPRASYFGARLLAQDIDQETVEAMTLRKGMSEEQWRSVDT